jgi:hypothetical protein
VPIFQIAIFCRILDDNSSENVTRNQENLSFVACYARCSALRPLESEILWDARKLRHIMPMVRDTHRPTSTGSSIENRTQTHKMNGLKVGFNPQSPAAVNVRDVMCAYVGVILQYEMCGWG